MNIKKSTIAASMLAASFQAWGSGFQVVEQGASNLGTALAGAVVNANNDATAAYWNPSAAFFVQSENKIDSAGSFLVPTMQFQGTATYPTGAEVPGTDGGNAGKLAFVPNFFYVKKFGDQWLGTVSITSPFGLETRYSDDFVGRQHGIQSNLMTLQINPSVAYKPLDWLSFSIGASADYINAELSSTTYITTHPALGPVEARTRANGHSWSGSFNVGVTAKFLETGRIGVAYRHRIDQNLSGSLYLQNSQIGLNQDKPITADLSLPSNMTVGVYYRFKDAPIAVMADYAFTQWNLFNTLTLVESDAPNTEYVTKENWKNTSRVSIGAHYFPSWDRDMVLRIGMAWDESPVRNSQYRTPRIPDSNRWWASFGIGYKIDWLNLDFGYTYILFDDVNINNDVEPGKGTINGSYTGHAHVISFQAGISW